MPRENIKTVAIPLGSGSVTFASGLEIGPQFTKTQNIVKNYVPFSGAAQAPFGIPDLPTTVDAVSFDPPAEFPRGIGAYYGSSAFNTGYFTGATRASNSIQEIYNIQTGQVLVGGTDLVSAAEFKNMPWSFAYMGNIATPATYVSRNVASTKKKIVFNGSGFILQDYTPNLDPGRAWVLYAHLNRLWLSTSDVWGRRSLVYFSDPFDPDIIRANNWLDIPDYVNAMFRANPSDLDLGSVAHLLFGCSNSIWVLDGDPTLGNAVLRQVVKGVGIRNQSLVAETNVGTAYLATDNMVYLMPMGATLPLPISPKVRNQFDDAVETTLGWREPYLYVFSGNEGDIWICDLTNFQNPEWWGPHKVSTLSTSFSGFLSDHSYVPPSSSLIGGEVNNVFVLDYANAQALKIVNGVTEHAESVFQTGYISEPDHDVAFWRSVLAFQQTDTLQEFVLTVTNNAGNAAVANFSVPAAAGSDREYKLTVTVPVHIRGDFFFLKLSTKEGQKQDMTNIRRWLVEYRVIPKQD